MVTGTPTNPNPTSLFMKHAVSRIFSSNDASAPARCWDGIGRKDQRSDYPHYLENLNPKP